MSFPKIVFEHRGLQLVSIRQGEPCPPRVWLNDLYRIGKTIYIVVAMRPEYDDSCLVVELMSCSPAWALKMSLERAGKVS
jgi:hypothetical protein